MKTICTALLLSLAVLSAQAQTPKVDERQAKQEKRIDQGVASGELTRRETAKLDQQQDRIDKLEDKAKADGKLTRRERAKLDVAQDAASRDIKRKKHNARDRKP